MSLTCCFYPHVAFATRQSELMLPMYFDFFQSACDPASSLGLVLACSLFLVLWSLRTRVTFLSCVFAASILCCLCGFVIHAQIEKCSQVIHDDRRTGSRAVLLC